MIRTNLSTRPFYNERSVRLLLLLLAVIVVAFTAFNASRVLRYSRSDTRLQTQASRDEARAADLRQQAVRLRATVNTKQIETASYDAREANDLIDRLSKDAAFAKVDLSHILRPSAYVGRAAQQVDQFIKRVVTPVRRRYANELAQQVELKV